MGHRKRKNQTPTTPVEETPEITAEQTPATTPAEETPAPVEQAPEQVETAKPAPSPLEVSKGLEKLIESLDPNDPVRQAVEEQLRKLASEQKASGQAIARQSFDSDLKAALTGILSGEDGLIAKHPDVELSGRRVEITFPPDGTEPFVMNDLDLHSSKGSKNGSGRGFGQSDWLPKGEKATYTDADGKVTEADSPSALAKAMGLLHTSAKTSVELFTKPKDKDSKQRIEGVSYKVDAVRGSHFRVTNA